jgi:hypothetical protein
VPQPIHILGADHVGYLCAGLDIAHQRSFHRLTVAHHGDTARAIHFIWPGRTRGPIPH